MSYRGTFPHLYWGTPVSAQATTCGALYEGGAWFGVPLDQARTSETPREGSDYSKAPSGLEDAWIDGTDHMLAGTLRWIPTADVVNGPFGYVSGWDGTRGLRAFLTSARDMQPFWWIADDSNLIVSPALGVDSNADGVVDNWTKVVSGLTTTYSVSSDGTYTTQVIAATAGTGSAYIVQVLPGPWPSGVKVTLSVDVDATAAVNGTIVLTGVDATGAETQVTTQTTAFSTSWARKALALTPSATYAYLKIKLGTLTTGTYRFKNAMLQVGTGTTYVGPNQWPMLLMEPRQGGTEVLEQADQSYSVQVKMRSSDDSTVEGY